MERALARAVPALLRGRTRVLDDVAVTMEVVERLDEEAPQRARLLLLVAHGRTLAARVRAGRSADEATVRLADGSALDLDDAERRLADKEEKRAFAPLREALDDAAADARERERDAERELEQFVHGETGQRWPDLDEARARAFVDRVEPALVEVGQAAAAAAFSEPPDGAAWARALDVPDGRAFASEAVRALVRAALGAAGGPPVRAVQAPRALAGWAALLDEGPRAAVVVGYGAGRAHRTLVAAGRALAMGLPDARVWELEMDALGEATGRALTGAAARRAVLGSERRDAERTHRLATVSGALRAMLLAAATRALLDGGAVADAGESASQAAGVRLPDGVLHELLRGGFPDGRARTRLGGLLRELEQRVFGARMARDLRARFDADWPVREDAWRALRAEAPEDRRLAVDEDDIAHAYVEAASELL